MTDIATADRPPAALPPAAALLMHTPSSRDYRVDVMRGLALLMIFVDHIPDNRLSIITLHAFGFCDAAEVFVLLAGFASTLAYGKSLERDIGGGLRRIGKRVGMIYGAHIGLLLGTLAVVEIWASIYGITPRAMAPIIASPVNRLLMAVTLQALPTYLDILPLYIVLLAAFPVLWMGMRRRPVLTLVLSGCLWLAVQIHPGIDLPNVLDGSKRWYFNPFAWQFLFAIGSGLALLMQRYGGSLPASRRLRLACVAYLLVALVMSAPWSDWGLPSLMPLRVDWNKSVLAAPRIIDILALTYLVLSSTLMRQIADSWIMSGARACGRHSLAIFAFGCMLAVFGRLIFRTFGEALWIQAIVDVTGISLMILAGLGLEYRRMQATRRLRISVAAGA